MAEPTQRGPVEDPNAQSRATAGNVPLAMVMTPRGAGGLDRVGSEAREIAGFLGDTNKMFQKFVEKKQTQWELEGKMAYAEGKTEEEIVAGGNRFTTAGYMSMKARTAGNVWLAQAMQEIEDGDKTLDSAQYQAKLAAQYKEIVDRTAGQDQYTRNLMTAIAEDSFPRLVAQQIKSNNEYRRQETFSSFHTMLTSESSRFDPADPDAAASINELIKPEVSGLPKELHFDAVTKAVTDGLSVDNPNLALAISHGGITKLSTLEGGSGLPPGLLGAVLDTESNGQRFAADGSVLTSVKGAKGEMQVMDGTNIDPGYGVTPAKDNSLDERARVGRDYLAALVAHYGDPLVGVMAYNAGPGNVDKYIAQVGAPGGTTGPTAEEFVQNFPFKETRDYVTKINSKMQSGQTKVTSAAVALRTSLVEQGFSGAQVTAIMREHSAYQRRAADRFDKDRILMEQQIISSVAETGNLEQALDQIGAAQAAHGYDDGWANSLSNKVVAAQGQWSKESTKSAARSSAIANNQIGRLPKSEQALAIQELRNNVLGEVTADEKLDDDQRVQQVRSRVINALVDNNVVDSQWATNLESVLTGKITNTDGSVKEEALAAYQDYLDLADQGGVAYAMKYMGAAGKLVSIAESHDASGALASPAALIRAYDQIERMSAPGYSAPTINVRGIQEQVDSWIKKQDVGMLSNLTGKAYKSSWMEVTDAEIKSAMADPRMAALIEARAINNAAGGMPEKAAIHHATKEVMAQSELVMGNVLIAGRGPSIREDMGIEHNSEPTAVQKSVFEYMVRYGHTMFGDAWTDAMTVGWHSDSLDLNLRKAPNLYMSYNPSNKMLTVDLYTNQARTEVTNTPKLIPIAEIGEYANATLFNPTYKDPRKKSFISGGISNDMLVFSKPTKKEDVNVNPE